MALKEGEEAHWEVRAARCTLTPLNHTSCPLQVVERLLFIYGKTNTGIGYVQGMNEVIGPLYYVFSQHPDEEWKGEYGFRLATCIIFVLCCSSR